MSEKVLVVGATGMLGRPVAERLKTDGFEVAIMTSNLSKAERSFGSRFKILEGDVTIPATLKVPLDGMDYLYINLSANVDPVKYQKVEIEGTCNLAKAAQDAGLKRIMNISSAASKGKEIGKIYLDAKVRAERAIIESGVKYTIMRPSWFFETLPHFINNERAVVIGKQPLQIHWLAASDYAAQVSKAFRTEAAANKCFYNLGPEKLTMLQALQKYCERIHPDIRAKEIPFWMAKLFALMTGNKQLRKVIPFFEYFSAQDENVDSTEANAILGNNNTTIQNWLDTLVKSPN